MKTPIAMRCTQEQWDSIKDNFDVDIVDDFDKYPYLVNNYEDNYLKIGNSAIPEQLKRQIHETFNAKIFLEACGIVTFTVTKKQIKEAKDLKDLFPQVFMSKEEILIAEAKKRGFKKGVYFIEADKQVYFIEKDNFYFVNSRLYVDALVIYENGKWAQIVTVTPI